MFLTQKNTALTTKGKNTTAKKRPLGGKTINNLGWDD